MKRRKFLASSLSLATIASCGLTGPNVLSKQAVQPNALNEWPISRLQKAMVDGELSALEIVNYYMKRINDIDKRGPTLNSLIHLNKKALDLAKTMDEERRQGKVRGVLHGIPVQIKDNIDTSDMPTTGGSLALKNSLPKHDAFVIQKLKEAGAIILGKTNLSEWANFRSTRSSSGWSAIVGQTKNPYALNRNPCGSSSGPAVAVSANLCAAAIGTETDGSIVCPSNANGTVGIKPTVGLVSRTGIIPISKTQDTAGPMCRTVEDASILLGAMVGVDQRDNSTEWAKNRIEKDYTKFLKKGGLNYKRLGIARKRMGFHEKVDQLMEDAFSIFNDHGAINIDLEGIFKDKGVHEAEFTVLLYEFKDGINKYLASLSDPKVKNLGDLIAFNIEYKTDEMPYFQQEIFIQANKKGDLSSKEYKDALALCRRGARKNGIDRVMDENNLDAIVAPTGGPAWVTDLVTGDHFLGGSSSAAAIAGYPNITVPAGYIHGLPVGISFFGRPFSEPILIEIAYSFEQITNHRQPPKYVNYV